jgi:CheY-like chemotaxis protein
MAAARQAGSPFPDPQERIPAILVVEDEVLIRLVIADYLRDCGFRVFEAGTAAEAVEILEADKAAIDLVFADICMPGEMDGFGLARWVRNNRPRLPIVLTSGDAKKSQTAKELCENEPFFSKPYEVAEVVAHIRAVIDRRTRKDDS